MTTPVMERFWSKVRIGDGCWEWQATRLPRGYGQFQFKLDGGKWRHHGAHRVAWMLERGPIPPGVQVCHRCDNPRCVRPSHLFLGTAADNVRDMDRKGRRVSPLGPRPRAEEHHAAWRSTAAENSRKSAWKRCGARSGAYTKPECRVRGTAHGLSKLTDEKVGEMRALRRGGMSWRDIARRYAVSHQSAAAAIRGETWSHVPDPVKR